MNEGMNIVTTTTEALPMVNQIEEGKEDNNMNEVIHTVEDILTISERIATNEANEAREALAKEVIPAQKKGKLTEAEKAEKKAMQAQKKAISIDVKIAKQNETALKLLAKQEEAKQELKVREEEARQKKQEEARKAKELKEREEKEKAVFGSNLLALAKVNRMKSKPINKKDIALQDLFTLYINDIIALQKSLFEYAKLSHDLNISEETVSMKRNECFALEKKALHYFNQGEKGIHCKANDIVYLTHLAVKKGRIGKEGNKTTLPESQKMFQGLFESFALDRKEGKDLLSINEIEEAKAKAKEAEAKAKAEALLQANK